MDTGEFFRIADTLETMASKLDRAPLEKLNTAAEDIGKSWSGSWLGYHSLVYYHGFQPVPAGARFSQEWGLMDGFTNPTQGTWEEFDFDTVVAEIERRAGNPDLSAIETLADEAEELLEESKSRLSSLLTPGLRDHPDDAFFRELVENIKKTKVITRTQIVDHLRPSGQLMSRDSTAATAGLKTPPHLDVWARARALCMPFDACDELAKFARRTGSHLANLDYDGKAPISKERTMPEQNSILSRIEQGTLVIVVGGLISALIWGGSMQGQLNALERPYEAHKNDLTAHALGLKNDLGRGEPGPTGPPGPPGVGMPIGSIVPFGGSRDSVPDGWRVCDGGEMQVSEYPELYGVIGTLWGGVQNVYFNLPNLNGAFLRGVDFSGNIDTERKRRGDDRPGTPQSAATAMPKRPFVTSPAGGHSHRYAGVKIGSGNWQSGGTEKPGAHVTALTADTSHEKDHIHPIAGGDDETRPYNYAVVFIIRAKFSYQ